MAFLSLVFGIGRDQSSIGAMNLDALLSEETKLTADVTSYPVETGAEISDNINQHPEELSITGRVSGGSILAFQAGGRSKLINAKHQIREMHAQREPVTILTGMDSYDGYAMTSATVSRDNTGDWLEINASFRKINIVDVQKTEIPREKVDTSTQSHELTSERAGKTAQEAGGVSQDSADTVELDDATGGETPSNSWLYSLGETLGVFQ